MKRLSFATLCLAIAVLFAGNAFGQATLKLEHDSSWEIAQRQCTIRVSQLANLSGEASAPLYLSVYARAGNWWDGTGSPGILVARAPIDALAANETRNNIEVVTKARAIPPGAKYTALVVETKDGRKYVVQDFVVYTSTYTFPRGQSGGVGSNDSGIGTGDVALIGDVTLGGTSRRAEYSINQIRNLREITSSGLLRLAIYATPEPYNGSASPTVVANRVLGELAQGDFYTHLQGKLTMKRPGRGTFYLTVAVEEDNGSGYETVSYATIPEPRQF
jgi:hypothetical protein